MGVSLNGKIDAITTEVRGGKTFLFKVIIILHIFYCFVAKLNSNYYYFF